MASKNYEAGKNPPPKPRNEKPNSTQVQTSVVNTNLDDTIENFLYEDKKLSFEDGKAKVKELLFQNPEGIEQSFIPHAFKVMYQQSLRYSDLHCSGLEELCSKLCKNNIIELRYGKQGKLFAYPKKEWLINYRSEQNEKRLAETDFEKFFDVGLNKTVKLPNNVLGPDDDIPVEKWEDYENSGYLDLYVSEVESPSNFYVQLRRKGKDLDLLMNNMENYYIENEHKLQLGRHRKNLLGMHVAAIFAETNGYEHVKPYYMGWHRAKIVQTTATNALILYIDYGTTRAIAFQYLRYLNRKFATLPAQGIRCTLAGAYPLDSKQDKPRVWSRTRWSEFATRRFFELVSMTNHESLPIHSRGIVGQVVKTPWKTRDPDMELKLPLILYDTVTNPFINGILVNDLLIKEGFAEKDKGYMTNDGLLPWEYEAKKAKLLSQNERIPELESIKDLEITESLVPSRQPSPDGLNQNLHKKGIEDNDVNKKELAPSQETVSKARTKVENWLLSCGESKI